MIGTDENAGAVRSWIYQALWPSLIQLDSDLPTEAIVNRVIEIDIFAGTGVINYRDIDLEAHRCPERRSAAASERSRRDWKRELRGVIANDARHLRRPPNWSHMAYAMATCSFESFAPRERWIATPTRARASSRVSISSRLCISSPVFSTGESWLLIFSDWLRVMRGEDQPGLGEAAVDEFGMALDVGESSAEGAGEVFGIGESGVGHRPAP